MPPIQLKNLIWKEPQRIELPFEFKSSLALPELVMQLLYQRGIQHTTDVIAFLDFRKYTPASPYDLPDMEKGVMRTTKAIKLHELIGVWGDFDVDGQTSTAVLVSTLRTLGANVIYHIPVRGRESHGIQLEALKTFLKLGVSLIVTCDTGISDHDSIAYAQKAGVDVIVTDHHTLPSTLPPAFAVINPQTLEPAHKLRPLPGVGTAYKLAEALLAQSDQIEYSDTLHDLVAMGIIADIAEIRGDARYLVQSGIDKIRNSSRPSIRAMLDGAAINHEQFSEQHISYSLAPRLNAVGRLADANPMVEFLLSEDPTVLSVTVNQLEGLNARRKLLCDQVFQGALAQIEQTPALLDHPVLMLSHPEWPAGVVGIAASRLISILHRPVILFVAPEGEKMRGSARSIEGINIIAAISQQSELLSSYGGHPMAAGLALDSQNFKQFQRNLDNTVAQLLTEHPITQELEIDAFCAPSSLDMPTIRSVEMLAPFGAGNPPLTFASQEMRLVGSTQVGKTHEHIQMVVEDIYGNQSKLIWWQGAGLPQPEGIFDMAYTARTSTYRGQPQVQLEWLDYRNPGSNISVQSARKYSGMLHHDYRLINDPKKTLDRIVKEHQPQILKEGTDSYQVSGLARDELKPSDSLIIWTVPPSQSVLEEILHIVTPSQIFWFGGIPDENDLAIFLRKIAKTIKDRLANLETVFNVDKLASVTATTPSAVVLAVRWLASRGDIRILSENTEQIQIEIGGQKNEMVELETRTQLTKTVVEIQSYRTHFLRAEINHLLED